MIGNDHHSDPPGGDTTLIEPHESKSGFTPLTLDPERYAEHFEDMEISEADQKALLEALWSIMVAFVDLGFDVKDADKYLPDIFNNDATPNDDVVDYESSKTTNKKRKDGA